VSAAVRSARRRDRERQHRREQRDPGESDFPLRERRVQTAV